MWHVWYRWEETLTTSVTSWRRGCVLSLCDDVFVAVKRRISFCVIAATWSHFLTRLSQTSVSCYLCCICVLMQPRHRLYRGRAGPPGCLWDSRVLAVLLHICHPSGRSLPSWLPELLHVGIGGIGVWRETLTQRMVLFSCSTFLLLSDVN